MYMTATAAAVITVMFWRTGEGFSYGLCVCVYIVVMRVRVSYGDARAHIIINNVIVIINFVVFSSWRVQCACADVPTYLNYI